MPELSTTPRVFSVSRRLRVAAVEEKGRKTNWLLRGWRPRNFWPASYPSCEPWAETLLFRCLRGVNFSRRVKNTELLHRRDSQLFIFKEENANLSFRDELIFTNSLFELPFFTRWDDNEKTIMWIDLWIFWNLFFCSLVWMVLRLNELKWWLNVFWMVLRENENDARFLCGFLWEFFEFWSWFVWYPIVWYHIVICNIEISLFSFLEISSFLEL